jgi:two-component system NtrC family sensor kinase
MIKVIISTFLYAITFESIGFCQNMQIDSIKHQLNIASNDTSRVLIMSDLSFAYSFRNPDSSLIYANHAVELSEQINFPRGKIRALFSKGSVLETKGDMPEALESGFTALNIARKRGLQLETSMCLTLIGNVFYDLNDFSRAIDFYNQATAINEAIRGKPGAEYWRIYTEVNFGTTLMLNNQLDSSFVHLQKSYTETLHDAGWHPVFLMFFGWLQFRMGKQDTGLNYLHQSIEIFENNRDPYSTSDACRIIARCFLDRNDLDSAIYYAEKALREARSIGYQTSILYASNLLTEAYESRDVKQALYFRKVFDTTNDILYGPNKVKSLQKTLSEEQDRQRKAEAERIAWQNRLKEYAFIAGLVIILLIAFIFYRNNLQKKKANILLQQQKEKVEITLVELKSTQAQLIQSEKMASLGELTAGIAHEIQNPLNFVNNFSEVNKELIAEMKNEIDTGNLNEAKTIAKDVEDNEEKIIFHGRRADAIVKGMLMHSRRSSGVKEPTDLNALADEYFRLAYHGLRAKDKEFNATMKTDFDNSIGKINIIPQDIGRVLLNLYNNAFYAVTEKKKSADANYEPTVSVSTKKSGNQISISVRDNGNGIPQKVLDKIFQPFFTTKPTGEGTGLGLSLSYDIVKAHGGEISVNTREGEFTEFVVHLPGSV